MLVARRTQSAEEDLQEIATCRTELTFCESSTEARTILPGSLVSARAWWIGERFARLEPSKATLADTELASNALEASPELVTTKETPPGEYSICFQAEMPWKLPLHPESLASHVAL
ncbi:MAG: hypothetical protein ACK56W_25040 [Pirellula sp.]|jgi:hypothetical protein|nr:hypothetical protein [Pirellula sp.]